MDNEFEILSVNKPQEFDPLTLTPLSSFTQSYAYGELQQLEKRKVIRFKMLHKKKVISYFQILKYPLIHNTNYLYIAHGPVFKSIPSNEALVFLKNFFNNLNKQENSAFLRFDIFPPQKKDILKKSFKNIFIHVPNYSYYSAYFQTKYDWVLNVDNSEDLLLNKMHPKTRYNINLALKKGVTTEIISGEQIKHYFDVFYQLLKETAERGKFSLRPRSYYKSLFELATKDKNQVLMLAKHNNIILAAYFIIFYGEVAYYPFGGSSAESRNKMPTYLLHWKAILEAKKRGCAWYNFGGIDLGDEISHDNWSGISNFKVKFGGQKIEYSDFYDVVSKPLVHKLYNFRKKLTK